MNLPAPTDEINNPVKLWSQPNAVTVLFEKMARIKNVCLAVSYENSQVSSFYNLFLQKGIVVKIASSCIPRAFACNITTSTQNVPKYSPNSDQIMVVTLA